MDKDLEPYIDLEVYTDQELQDLQKTWKDKRNFDVIADGETFSILACSDHSVYDFKRLILTELKGKPFFFVDEEVSNDKDVKELSSIKITFRLDKWNSNLRDLSSSKSL